MDTKDFIRVHKGSLTLFRNPPDQQTGGFFCLIYRIHCIKNTKISNFISIFKSFKIMKTRTLLFAILILIIPVSTYGQLGGLLRKASSKVMNTVGKEANKEANKQADSVIQAKTQTSVDNAVDKQFQNNQGNQNDNNGSQSQSSGSQGRGGFKLGSVFGGADIKHNEEYSFDGRMYMQMETYDKKEPSKVDYFIYFNQNIPNAGIEFKTVAKEGDQSKPMATVMVYDNENKCFMMLIDNDDKKTGIISTMPSDSALKAHTYQKTGTNTETTPPSIVKTGNTRVIAGYKCDEYKITEQNKKEYALVWMTKDLKIKADKSNWSKAGIPSYYNYPGFEGSSMLAMESYDANNKLAMKMETKEINQNYPHKISAAGYTFIKMNFNQMNSPQNKK